MKRGLILIFILLYLSIPLCFALSLEIENKNIQPEETFLAKLSGEFEEPISRTNIEFYEQSKRIFPEYDIAFYGNTYYIYAYFTREDNYTIKIKNILYKDPKLKSTTIEENFEIKKNLLEDNKTKILSIKPGLISTIKEAEIIFSNKGTSPIDLEYDSYNITLKPGDYEKYIFNPEHSFSQLIVKTYKTFTIPIIFIPLIQSHQNQISDGSLKTSLINISLKLFLDTAQQQELILTNTKNTPIKFINITSDLSILEMPKLSEIAPERSETIKLKFLSKQEGFFSGNITINYSSDLSQNLLIIPVEIYVFSKETPKNQAIISGKTCEEFNTTSCKEGEICRGITIYTESKPAKHCCKGNCSLVAQKNKSDGSNLYLGLLIIFLIGLVALIIYKKLKKVPQQNPLKQFEESYKNRHLGTISRT